MASNQVTSQIRERSINGSYDTIYNLGPELRYTGALPSSNNNNLEEELLLGEDKITTKWYDDVNSVYRTTIEYRKNSDSGNYYVLEIYDYVKKSAIGITVVDGVMIFDLDNKIVVTEPTVIREEKLFYIQGDGNRIAVSEKQIIQDANAVVKEVITNLISA